MVQRNGFDVEFVSRGLMIKKFKNYIFRATKYNFIQFNSFQRVTIYHIVPTKADNGKLKAS